MEKSSLSSFGSGEVHSRPAAEDLETLRSRHRELEQRLTYLERHLSLSPAEQIERSRLKKEKLRIKDRLAALAPRSAAAGG